MSDRVTEFVDGGRGHFTLRRDGQAVGVGVDLGAVFQFYTVGSESAELDETQARAVAERLLAFADREALKVRRINP